MVHGKSTTIKMLTGILQNTEGSINVLGLNPAKDRKKLSYKIGTVFGQKEQLWTHLTPFDNFKFFGAIYDLDDEEIEKRIEDLEKVFKLTDFINTPVRNLSLGQRIRCEIVASLIHKPEILVVKEDIRKLIKKMNKEFNTTIFLTSHDIGDIEKLCKRVIIINSGKIIMDDKMDNLKYHYLNRKIIEIKSKKKLELKEKEGFKILKNKNDKMKIELDCNKNSINDVLKSIDLDNIMDISISSVPLEEIITEIYRGD